MAKDNNKQGRSRPDGREVQTRRPVLDNRKKELMMAVLIQNRQAFAAMRDSLKHDHFSRYDRGMSVAWRLTIEYEDEYGNLPDKEYLLAEIEDACNSDPNLLNSSEQDQLSTFLDYAFDPDSFKTPVHDSDAAARYAIKIAKQFLHERLAAKAKEQILDKDQIATSMPDVLSKFQAEAEAIEAISTDTVAMAFADGWDKKSAVKLFSTGLAFLDKFLGGGWAPGEVYGLMGPYGSCKTTLVAMCAVEAAYYFYGLPPALDEKPTLVFVVSYEARLAEMRNRTLGYGGKILRTTLENMTSKDDLSHSENLKEYEKRLFEADIKNGKPVNGEYERASALIPVLNQHMVLLDMTGHEKKGTGGGGVSEIAARISSECRARNAKCGLVLIDYVGAMVRRNMDTKNLGNDQLRHEIGSTPINIKSKIADEYDCPVVLLHQLSAESNGRNPTAAMHHTDSAECKSFAENLDFCFVIGVPDKVDQVALFGCTKHRRQPPKEFTIIKINGGMNAVECVDHLYTVNAHQKKIMRIDDNNRVAIPRGASVPRTPPATSASNVGGGGD